jgi:hypothetical protein
MFALVKLFFTSFVETTTKAPKAPKLTRRQKHIESYLSQSVDRCDFERREKHLMQNGFFL